MSRPKLLDLFCGSGGAAMGYHRAGFDVYGIDLTPQPDYPFPFYQGDAVDALKRLWAGEMLPFTHPDGSVEWLGIESFAAIHGSPPCQPYSTGVVSRSSKWNHTKGKDEPALIGAEHPNCRGLAKRSAAEFGWDYRDMSVTGKGRRAGTSDRWAFLLGIYWPVTQHGLAEAIPPAYSEFIGAQLLDHISKEKAA